MAATVAPILPTADAPVAPIAAVMLAASRADTPVDSAAAVTWVVAVATAVAVTGKVQ